MSITKNIIHWFITHLTSLTDKETQIRQDNWPFSQRSQPKLIPLNHI